MDQTFRGWMSESLSSNPNSSRHSFGSSHHAYRKHVLTRMDHILFQSGGICIFLLAIILGMFVSPYLWLLLIFVIPYYASWFALLDKENRLAFMEESVTQMERARNNPPPLPAAATSVTSPSVSPSLSYRSRSLPVPNMKNKEGTPKPTPSKSDSKVSAEPPPPPPPPPLVQLTSMQPQQAQHQPASLPRSRSLPAKSIPLSQAVPAPNFSSLQHSESESHLSEEPSTPTTTITVAASATSPPISPRTSSITPPPPGIANSLEEDSDNVSVV